jgi:hypothetical protein
MPKITMSFSFLISDGLMERLESVSQEVKKPIGEIIGDILETRRDKFASVTVAILTHGVHVYEKAKRERRQRK